MRKSSKDSEHFRGLKMGEIVKISKYSIKRKNSKLPEVVQKELNRFATEAKNRRKVVANINEPPIIEYEGGLIAIFTGDTGSGKTMAAQIIADKLQLDLYRIDLSQVVNKYIGETEKNLERILAKAENSNLILLFDEADALFGKRSNAKDSHDRFSNSEVSYLIKRLEKFKGIALLAVNNKDDIDNSFLRQIRFVLHFPLPDSDQRERTGRPVLLENQGYKK